MNNKYSDLQNRYPLSPKKFLKKMIDKLLGLYILAVFLTVGLIIGIIFSPSSGEISMGAILFVILILGLVMLTIITALNAWYVRVYIREYYYDASENFITIKKGVFSPTEIHVQWQKIQDVYVDQDILDRFMGLYDVHIASATASSGIEAHIDGVSKESAEALKKIFLDKLSNTGASMTMPASMVNTNSVNNSSATNGVTLNLSEEISNEKYPILGKWIFVSTVTRFLTTLITVALFMFFLLTSAKGLSESSDSVFLLIYLGVSIIISIINFIALIIWKKNYSYKFNAENIYYKTGVLSISEKHMPYSSIQDVSVSQSFLERIFGLAKVNIENAAQSTTIVQNGRSMTPAYNGIQLVGISPENASHITEIIKTTILRKNSSVHGL